MHQIPKPGPETEQIEEQINFPHTCNVVQRGARGCGVASLHIAARPVIVAARLSLPKRFRIALLNARIAPAQVIQQMEIFQREAVLLCLAEAGRQQSPDADNLGYYADR